MSKFPAKKFTSNSPEKSWPRIAVFGLFLLALAGAVWVMAQVLPDGIDWTQTYRPAALELLVLRNPYAPKVTSEAPFVADPWGLLPLIPLAILPLQIGRAVLLLLSLVACGSRSLVLFCHPRSAYFLSRSNLRLVLPLRSSGCSRPGVRAVSHWRSKHSYP